MTLVIELGKRTWPSLFIGGKENREPGTAEAPTAACASEAERSFRLCLGHQPLCPSPEFILSSMLGTLENSQLVIHRPPPHRPPGNQQSVSGICIRGGE